MHELSICQQMIRQVRDIALQHQATSVERIKLQIGPLSGVDVSLLKHAFPFAAKQTIAENSQLLIEELPVIIKCNQCGLKTHTQVNKLVCGQCGSEQTRLISGDEMLLVSVELNKSQSVKEQHTT